MTVNEKKTQLLCVTATNTSLVNTYIRTEGGSKIESQKSLKLLGFYFSDKPNVTEHITKMAAKFRGRLWFLRHLKKAALPVEDLVHIYSCFLLPILDYASPVYHPLLTKEQTQMIERLQATALKIIYGWSNSYSSLLNLAGIEYVQERRQRLTDKFIIKTAANKRYQEKGFPLKEFVHHDLRKEKYYMEEFARTDRLYNAPIFYYRRRLNEIGQTDLNREGPQDRG